MEIEDLQRRFGAVIRRLRLKARLGQEKLADQAGLHRTHISLIERGQGMPTLHVIHKLSAALGTTMAEMMEQVESEEENASDPPAMPRGRPPRQGRKGEDESASEGG